MPFQNVGGLYLLTNHGCPLQPGYNDFEHGMTGKQGYFVHFCEGEHMHLNMSGVAQVCALSREGEYVSEYCAADGRGGDF